MLKHNEANPLAVFGLRRVEHCPPHFTRITFDPLAPEKSITDWIWVNLSGRFYINDEYYTTETGISVQRMVAFEQPGEASMFALTLDQINKHDFW
jgi:hypothetical protein